MTETIKRWLLSHPHHKPIEVEAILLNGHCPQTLQELARIPEEDKVVSVWEVNVLLANIAVSLNEILNALETGQWEESPLGENEDISPLGPYTM